ncbi:MAG: hypothetical protein R3B60_01595 [Candidatus Paceibacterota bacterium]
MKKYNFVLLFSVFFLICPTVIAETKVKVGKDINGKKVILYGEVSEVTVPKEINQKPTTIIEALSKPDEIIYHNEQCLNEKVDLVKFKKICSWQEYKYQTDSSEIIKVGYEISESEPTLNVILFITLLATGGLSIYFLSLLYLFKTKRYKSLADSPEILVGTNILLFFLTSVPFLYSLNVYNKFLVSGFIMVLASTIFSIVNYEKKTGSKAALVVFLGLATLALIFFLIGFYSLELKVL